MSATFPELLTDAHRRGDAERVDALLDTQSAVREEIAWRIEQANAAAENYAHQLHAIANLLDGAAEQDMDVSSSDAPLLTGYAVAVKASQEWAER